MTINQVVLSDRWIQGGKRHSVGTIQLSSESYATPGLIMPTAAMNKMGFIRQIDTLEIVGRPGGGTTSYMLKFTLPTASSSPTIRLQSYEEESAAAGGPLLESPTAALTDGTYAFRAVGW